MNDLPENLKYTKEHEWVKIDGKLATVGITGFAQSNLGDIVFCELPKVGDALTQAKTFGVVESVKAVSDLFAPLSGKVTAVNETLADNPALLNSDPYGKAWLVKLELKDAGEVAHLLDPKAYAELVK